MATSRSTIIAQEDVGREAAGIYGDIFERARDPIFIHDIESGEVVDCNDAGAALFGTTEADIIGTRIRDLAAPGVHDPDLLEEVLSVVRAGGRRRMEWEIEREDGQRRLVDVTIKPAHNDGLTRMVTYVHDVSEVREREAELAETRREREAVFNSPQTFIGLLEPDGTLVEANRTALDFAGVDAEAVTGEYFPSTPWWSEDPNGRSELEAAIEAARRGETREFTTTHVSPDGERIIAAVTVRPVFENETVVSIIAEGKEITERVEKQAQLRERKQELEAFVENLPVILFTIDADGVFQRAAGQGMEALPVTAEEMVGTNVFDAYAHNEDIIAAVERAMDGEEVRVELVENDTVFETWYRPLTDEHGMVTQVIGVSRDVTENVRQRERVEAVSEAAHELIQAHTAAEAAERVVDITDSVIDRLLAGVWTAEADADRLAPMAASESALELLEAESVGELPTIGTGNEVMAAFEAGETKVLDEYPMAEVPGETENDFGTALLVPLGDHGILTAGSVDIDAADEMELHLLEILARTTVAALDRIERDEELRAQREELDRSNESLQQFAHVASHDLQEPLRMVASYVDLLDAEYGDQLDEEAREYMDFAVDGAQRMQAMVDGLLAYSRVQTRAGEFEPVDTEAVARTVVSDLSLLCEETGATVEVGSLPPVVADENQLAQVLQNLVKNGIAYADEAGFEPVVEVTAERTGETVTVAVSYNGPGVEESASERIFEIFERGGTDAEGTGIGLALCRRIVERHDGDIWVDSPPGDGATFMFALPAAEEGDDA